MYHVHCCDVLILFSSQTSDQWDANIWTLEFDPETGGDKIKKTWLGQTSKKHQAVHLCDRGIYKRNRGEFEPMPIEPGKPEENQFEIGKFDCCYYHCYHCYHCCYCCYCL